MLEFAKRAAVLCCERLLSEIFSGMSRGRRAGFLQGRHRDVGGSVFFFLRTLPSYLKNWPLGSLGSLKKIDFGIPRIPKIFGESL